MRPLSVPAGGASAGPGDPRPEGAPTVEVHLGEETDAALLGALRAAVLAQGGAMRAVEHSVAGSQELVRYAILLPGGALEAVAETYVGLSLRGPAPLIGALLHAMAPLAPLPPQQTE